MKDDELEQLLDDIESDLVERKESPTDGEKIRQTICAFANDLPQHNKPGVLFIGVSDRGNPIGLTITDQLLLKLASIRDDGNILPLPSIDVQKRRLKNQDVVVVIVHPSYSPPVRYKGVTWIRSGPRRGIANSNDEHRLSEKRRYRDVPSDIRPIESAGIEAIDELFFRRTYLPSAVAEEIIEQNQRTFEEQLIAVKFCHPGSPTHPTVLGLLVVGKTPTDWIPSAYIQFLRIDGMELGDPIKNSKEIRGPLPDLLNELDNISKANIQISADISSRITEKQMPDYPLVALQQILRNAVLHRSYESTNSPVRFYWFDDRIEIHSPGGPFGHVTKENFGQPGVCDYRNPNLAAAMKDLGYVQRFGYGIALARQEMKKNSNPDPEFYVEDAHVAVILRRRR